MPRCSAIAALLVLAACQGGATDHALRQAWLVDALAADNQVWFSRDADPLREKFTRMGADPYDYMRGSAGVSFRDWSRPTPGRARTSFLVSPGADAVLLVGDPHPENVGTTLPGAIPEPTSRLEPLHPTLEVTDFDGAGFGPWTLDVRRATQGLAVLLHGADCDRACRLPILEAWAEAYADEVGRQRTGSGTWVARQAAEGSLLVDQLVTEALDEGLGRQRLGEWTRPTANGPRFRIDLELVDGRGTRPLSAEEAAQVDRLVAAWHPEAPGSIRVHDAARRYGIGVASVPAVRYAVLFDLGSPEPDDDQIAMFREVVDPPVLPGLFEDPALLWDDNADRIVGAARTLWSRPDADPVAAGMADGPMTFKAVTGSSFHEALDHEDIADDVRLAPDGPARLRDLAQTLARQLAATHGRSETWAGEPAIGVIHADLQHAGARFSAELVQTAEQDLEQTLLDHRLFTLALDELGPLLGLDRLGVR